MANEIEIEIEANITGVSKGYVDQELLKKVDKEAITDKVGEDASGNKIPTDKAVSDAIKEATEDLEGKIEGQAVEFEGKIEAVEGSVSDEITERKKENIRIEAVIAANKQTAEGSVSDLNTKVNANKVAAEQAIAGVNSKIDTKEGELNAKITAETNARTASEEEIYGYINTKISAAIIFKGSVATVDYLPQTGQKVGDMYNVEDTGKNYAWDGYQWDDLGGTFDASEIDKKINKNATDIAKNATDIASINIQIKGINTAVETASVKADQAQTDASQAKEDAQQAQTTAGGVSAIANEAKTTAEQAQATAESASSSISTLDNRITTLDAKVDTIIETGGASSASQVFLSEIPGLNAANVQDGLEEINDKFVDYYPQDIDIVKRDFQYFIDYSTGLNVSNKAYSITYFKNNEKFKRIDTTCAADTKNKVAIFAFYSGEDFDNKELISYVKADTNVSTYYSYAIPAEATFIGVTFRSVTQNFTVYGTDCCEILNTSKFFGTAGFNINSSNKWSNYTGSQCTYIKVPEGFNALRVDGTNVTMAFLENISLVSGASITDNVDANSQFERIDGYFDAVYPLFPTTKYIFVQRMDNKGGIYEPTIFQFLKIEDKKEEELKEEGWTTLKLSDFKSDDISDSDAIEEMINFLHQNSKKILIFDVRSIVIDRSILLPSHTKVYLQRCIIRQADYTFDTVFRGANVILPTPLTEENINYVPETIETLEDIHIIGDGCSYIRPPKNRLQWKGEDTIGDVYGARNVQIVLTCINNASIVGINFYENRCYCMQTEYCDGVVVKDIQMRTFIKNGDGIDVRSGCKNIYIRNFTGKCFDDLIAINGSIRDKDYDFYVNQPQFAQNITDHATYEQRSMKNIVIDGVNCIRGTHRCIGMWSTKYCSIDEVSISNVYIYGHINNESQNAIQLYGTDKGDGTIGLTNTRVYNVIYKKPSLLTRPLFTGAAKDIIKIFGVKLPNSNPLVGEVSSQYMQISNIEYID